MAPYHVDFGFISTSIKPEHVGLCGVELFSLG